MSDYMFQKPILVGPNQLPALTALEDGYLDIEV